MGVGLWGLAFSPCRAQPWRGGQPSGAGCHWLPKPCGQMIWQREALGPRGVALCQLLARIMELMPASQGDSPVRSAEESQNASHTKVTEGGVQTGG